MDYGPIVTVISAAFFYFSFQFGEKRPMSKSSNFFFLGTKTERKMSKHILITGGAGFIGSHSTGIARTKETPSVSLMHLILDMIPKSKSTMLACLIIPNAHYTEEISAIVLCLSKSANPLMSLFTSRHAQVFVPH